MNLGANTAASDLPNKLPETNIHEEFVQEALHSKSHISPQVKRSQLGPSEFDQANEATSAKYDYISDDLDNDNDDVDVIDEDFSYKIDHDITAVSGLVSEEGEIGDSANVVTRAISLDELSL